MTLCWQHMVIHTYWKHMAINSNRVVIVYNPKSPAPHRTYKRMREKKRREEKERRCERVFAVCGTNVHAPERVAACGGIWGEWGISRGAIAHQRRVLSDGTGKIFLGYKKGIRYYVNQVMTSFQRLQGFGIRKTGGNTFINGALCKPCVQIAREICDMLLS